MKHLLLAASVSFVASAALAGDRPISVNAEPRDKAPTRVLTHVAPSAAAIAALSRPADCADPKSLRGAVAKSRGEACAKDGRRAATR